MTPRLPPPAPPKEQHVPTPHLGNRCLVLRDGTSDETVWGDTFTGMYHVPPEWMPTPRTVLDLGANIGLVAAHYRYLWPQAEIVAVEMDAENAAIAARNALGVRIRHEAVVEHPGVTFYDDTVRSAAAYAVGNGNRMVMGHTLRQIILRSFAGDAAGGVNLADFVKIDVEGMEWKLFANAEWAPLVRHLLVELHPAPGLYPEATDVAGALIEKARRMLDGAGFDSQRHEVHPQAVFAWRR